MFLNMTNTFYGNQNAPLNLTLDVLFLLASEGTSVHRGGKNK